MTNDSRRLSAHESLTRAEGRLEDMIDSKSIATDVSIRELIGEAVGEASMCWNPRPSSQVFDSEAAGRIVAHLYRMIVTRMNEYTRLSLAQSEAALEAAQSELGDLRTGTYTCHKCKKEQSAGDATPRDSPGRSPAISPRERTTMSDKGKAKKADPPEKIPLPCLECGKVWLFDPSSNEAQGIFNVFCSDKDCEDKYAWKQ